MVSFSIVFCKRLPVGGWACLPLWRISWVLNLLYKEFQTDTSNDWLWPSQMIREILIDIMWAHQFTTIGTTKIGFGRCLSYWCCHSWGLWNFSGGFNPERYETVGIIQGFQKMIEMVWSGWTTRHVFFFCVGWILVDFPASKDKSPQLASRFSPRYWGTGLEMWKALNIF